MRTHDDDKASRFAPHLRSIVVVLVALAGCSDANDFGGEPLGPDTRLSDTSPGQDTSTASDATAPDTTVADTVAADTGTRPDVGDDTIAALTLLKFDPNYLVPDGTAARRDLVVSDSRAAWIETDDSGVVRLMVWQTAWAQGTAVAPVAYGPANLQNPKQLALGEAHLYYVDDRFGDDDLFAIDLSNGNDLAVVTLPGAQQRPSANGSEVVWQDCRHCVTGNETLGRAIYRQDMATGSAAVVVSDSSTDDRDPTFGTMADGSLAIAWLEQGTATVRVEGDDGSSAAWALPEEAYNVALAAGVLAARPSKVILNPDSMYPSDVWLIDVQSGSATTATFHAELQEDASAAISASSTDFAWLEAFIPSTTDETRISLVTPVAGDPPSLSATSDIIAENVTRVALSDSRLAFLAPRDDNDGQRDVHVLVRD